MRRHLSLWQAPGYSLGMKFQAKFGSADVGMLWVACIWVFVWLTAPSHLPHGWNSLMASVWAVGPLWRVLRHYFVYWELEPACLREVRYWVKRDIPWQEVTHVGGFPATWASSDFLQVDFFHSPEVTPYTGRDRLVFQPGDRDGFIAALRRFAPQATFDV